MHVLITGKRHMGKSTLLRALAEELNRPLFGFVTQKEPALTEPERGIPVCIYPAAKAGISGEGILIGYCKDRSFTAFPDAFDRFAPKLADPPAGSIILMDEIGFMESGSEAFRNAVLALLDGNVPVLAAVKPDDHPFLRAVRTHPNARTFELTAENRNEIRETVRAFIRTDGWGTHE